MTRINCIPVQELSDRHLVAEYYELPRVFRLARDYWRRITSAIADPEPDLPAKYTMGKGHVRFFYDKLEYLVRRQQSLITEMICRGYKPAFRDASKLAVGMPGQLYNDWTPSDEDMAINRQRIAERLRASGE